MAIDVSAQIILPQNDKLQYRILELGNGLRAVLVHDAEADKAAASLDVSLPRGTCAGRSKAWPCPPVCAVLMEDISFEETTELLDDLVESLHNIGC